MVSASKAARMAKRADEKKPKKAAKVELDAHGNPIVEDAPATKDQGAVDKLTAQMDKHGLSDRVTTGVLSSLPASRDVKITSTSLVFHGKVLVTDSTLELTFGRRYGLLGENGCGKSTILKSIAAREFPVPEHVDIYLLNEGAPPTDDGALDWVVKEAERQLEGMEKKAEEVLEEEGPDSPILEDLYDVCISEIFFLSFLLRTVTDANYSIAYGQDGSFHFPRSCISHSDRSRFQQGHHQQEDQGHVRWMAYACCPRQGSLRQAFFALA